MRAVVLVYLAGSTLAATVPGCHFWIREVATGKNVGQGCVGKGWTVWPFVKTTGPAEQTSRIDSVKADNSCNLESQSTVYIAQFDGECTATVPDN